MVSTLKLSSCFMLLFFTVLSLQQKYRAHALTFGCTDDAACTTLCGLQGAGECVDGKYCKCAECPLRSVNELASLPKICTYEPITCRCPNSLANVGSGRAYFGHRCLHGLSPMCVCFCVPSTPSAMAGAIVDAIKCPFPKPGTSTTTTTPASTGGA